MSLDLLPVLTWASGLSALLAVVVYFYVIARRPQWIRLLNGSSLFFTGVALSLIAAILPQAARQGALFTIAATVALLIAAVLVQSWAALRNRKAWDGVDRRRMGDADAEGADR
jgi:NADH:ubiquinone oxidoreductase subunit K